MSNNNPSMESASKDPHWIPSDSEMINWVQRGYLVKPGPIWENGIGACNGWCVYGMSDKVIGASLTWRGAVEEAMRKEMSL